MQLEHVKKGLAEAAEFLMQEKVSVGQMGTRDARTASQWPSHPSGYGSWPWDDWIRSHRQEKSLHFLHMSLAAEGQETRRIYAALSLKVQPRKDHISLKVLASDPTAGPWKGKVLSSVLIGILLAQKENTTNVRQLWIADPAAGLIPTYLQRATDSGYTVKGVPMVRGVAQRIELLFPE